MRVTVGRERKRISISTLDGTAIHTRIEDPATGGELLTVTDAKLHCDIKRGHWEATLTCVLPALLLNDVWAEIRQTGEVPADIYRQIRSQVLKEYLENGVPGEMEDEA